MAMRQTLSLAVTVWLCAALSVFGVGLPQVRAIERHDVPSVGLPSGYRMPMDGLGTSGHAARTQNVLNYFLVGGRHIDHSDTYWGLEKVGDAVDQATHKHGVKRSDIFITSKVSPPNYGYDSAKAIVHKMLKDYKVDYIDLVLMHSPATTPATRAETWRALAELQKQGLIRDIGVSNFKVEHLQHIMNLALAPIAVNQLEFHPWVPDSMWQSVGFCHQHGIAVMAYGSVGSKQKPGDNATDFIADARVRQIGASHNKTNGQVLLRWATQHNVTVIPSTTNQSHMRDNLDIFDFVLSDHEMAALDDLPEVERHSQYWHPSNLNFNKAADGSLARKYVNGTMPLYSEGKDAHTFLHSLESIKKRAKKVHRKPDAARL